MQLLLRIVSSSCAWIVLPAAFVVTCTAFLLAGALPRGDPNADFTWDYGVTEWMIDYSGGFVRRGLFGGVMHFLWDQWSWHPATVAVVLSIAIYVAFCIYALRASAGLLPLWCLLTTAMAAAPLYTRNVIRKDVALLLIFVACVKVVKSSMGRPAQFVCLNAFLSLGLLLQESFAFFAVPTCIVLVGIAQSPARQSWTGLIGTVARGFVFCLPSACVLVALVLAHGSPEAAKAIHDAWRSAFLAPSPWPENPNGSIMWVGFTPAQALQVTWDALGARVLGVPAGVLIAVNCLAGALLIQACFRRYASASRARVFKVVCWFQCAACLPLFLGALDSGRWIMFALLSAFVLALECHELLSVRLFGSEPEVVSDRKVLPSTWRSPSWLPVSGILYGICPVYWTVVEYVTTTPPGSMYANWQRLSVLRLFD